MGQQHEKAPNFFIIIIIINNYNLIFTFSTRLFFKSK